MPFVGGLWGTRLCKPYGLHAETHVDFDLADGANSEAERVMAKAEGPQARSLSHVSHRLFVLESFGGSSTAAPGRSAFCHMGRHSFGTRASGS